MNIKENFSKIFKKLNLESTIWRDIHPDLLLMAFIHKSSSEVLDTNYLFYLEKKYKMSSYEHLEFIGDGVLQMISTNIVTDIIDIQTLKDSHLLRVQLVKNQTLTNYMKKKGVDIYITSAKKIKFCKKTIADVFEAIIGALYFHGFYIKGMGYSIMDHIKRWLIDNWYIKDTIKKYIKDKNINNGVPIESKKYDKNSKTGRKSLEIVYSIEECKIWLKDKDKNPKTRRKIKKNGPTYKKIKRFCIKYGLYISS